MRYVAVSLGLLFSVVACDIKPGKSEKEIKDEMINCVSSLPSRYSERNEGLKINTAAVVSYDGMVQIPAGEFLMGASDDQGRSDEYPQHKG